MKNLLRAINSWIIYLRLKIRLIKKQGIIKSTKVAKNVEVGKKVRIGKHIIIQPDVSIGDYSYFNTQFGQSYIESGVQIGKYCSIAPNVCIALGNHNTSYVTTSPILYDKKRGFIRKRIENVINTEKTIIGNDVWIGANANIKKGVKVGNGAVIAMNSVVTKNVPDYAIVAGNPARIIRYRFSAEVIKDLLLTEWWNWPEEKIRNNINYFYDIDAFLKNNRK